MIYPKDLKTGSFVGVTAPSAGCETEADIKALESARLQFEKLGYPVLETENVRSFIKGRSSSGSVRAKELHSLVADNRIRAIIAIHGGDFLMEMLPYVDFNLIGDNPKWFQGYSDITGLTFTITTLLDMATIYSYNFTTFGMQPWHKSLRNNIRLLSGENFTQESFDSFQNGHIEKVTGLEEFQLTDRVCWNNLYPAAGSSEEDGFRIKGRALGGCLDVLLTLVGTRFDHTVEFINKYKDDKILWFLESFDLGSEALTRGLWQLKEAGWFEHAAGFIFGRPAMYEEGYDISYSEAVLSVLGELKVPIVTDADIGHKPPQLAMMMGAVAEVRSKGGKGSIDFIKR
jgi:muramoyltetrapeptide carboxypeptidase